MKRTEHSQNHVNPLQYLSSINSQTSSSGGVQLGQQRKSMGIMDFLSGTLKNIFSASENISAKNSLKLKSSNTYQSEFRQQLAQLDEIQVQRFLQKQGVLFNSLYLVAHASNIKANLIDFIQKTGKNFFFKYHQEIGKFVGMSFQGMGSKADRQIGCLFVTDILKSLIRKPHLIAPLYREALIDLRHTMVRKGFSEQVEKVLLIAVVHQLETILQYYHDHLKDYFTIDSERQQQRLQTLLRDASRLVKLLITEEVDFAKYGIDAEFIQEGREILGQLVINILNLDFS